MTAGRRISALSAGDARIAGWRSSWLLSGFLPVRALTTQARTARRANCASEGSLRNARRTGVDGGRRRLAGDDRFETQIVVMASDSVAVSWLRLGVRFVFGTHCVRDRTGSSCAFGFNANWRMPVRPTASTLLSPV